MLLLLQCSLLIILSLGNCSTSDIYTHERLLVQKVYFTTGTKYRYFVKLGRECILDE